MAQHKCRICLEYCSDTISVYDQVATGVSYLDITLKLTNQLKLDGSSSQPLHICVPCANMVKTAYITKEDDYKLEIKEEIIIEENVKAVKLEDETATSNCSTFSHKERIHIVNKNEQTRETSLEDKTVTIEEALEVYYDKPCDNNYRRKLRSRSRVIDKLDKLQCDHCEYTPASLNDYTMHIKAEHANERTKNCNYCDKSFFDTQTLKDHLRSHSNTKNYECEVCGSKFAWKTTLSRHLKKHNILESSIASKKCESYEDEVAKLPFACKICDKKFSISSSLRRHSKLVHNSDDKSCYFCAFLPESPAELTTHVKQEHEDKRSWACKRCGNAYLQSKYLKRHLLTHKGIMAKHMCNVCNYKTQDKGEMVIHMRKHTGEQPFSCSKCDRKVKSFKNLKKHMKIHERDASDTPGNVNENDSKSVVQATVDTYVCKKCNKEFAHHSSLRKHSEGMHYIQISCCYCAYTPISSSDSERHIRKEHADKKYFACDQCDEAFISVRNLKTHLLLHCDNKNFVCKICNYKCINNFVLAKHLRKHTGEKPFQCSNCGMAFKQNRNLRVHLATQNCTGSINKVHEANPKNRKRAHIKHTVLGARRIYACKVCDKTFAFRGIMRRHNRNVHKINDTSCFFCDYVPTSNYDLHMHSDKEHADKKIISCEQCDKRFFDRTNLTSHLAVHSTIGIHVCEICGHKFAMKSSLIEHMSIHTGK